MEQLSLKEWLAQQPLPEEIRYNDDGSAYLAIEVVKPKLDYLSPTWSTSNFQHHFTQMPVFKDGEPNGITLWASASVELSITYKVDIRTEEGKNYIPPTFQTITRVISGSATFDVQKYYPNTNWAQTALSLCIVAAAKELGTFFGKELNKERLTVPTEKVISKRSDKITNTIYSAIKQMKS